MLKIDGKSVTMLNFPDGTFSTKVAVPVEEDGKTIKDAVTITWLFHDNSELIALIFLTKHLRAAGVRQIDLCMPYIPNARQDRVKNPEDIFTLKYFAQIINDLDFRTVQVLDPHSYVSEALIENIRITRPEGNIKRVLEMIGTEKEVVFFYPDEGAMKRYSGKFANPFVFGIKNRDWKTGDILGLNVEGDVEQIKGKDILIVDDICSRGGTFYHSAKKLKELGVGNIYLYISHCENTILEGEIFTSGLIEKVFTTNSIFTKEHEKMEVLNLW